MSGGDVIRCDCEVGVKDRDDGGGGRENGDDDALPCLRAIALGYSSPRGTSLAVDTIDDAVGGALGSNADTDGGGIVNDNGTLGLSVGDRARGRLP